MKKYFATLLLSSLAVTATAKTTDSSNIHQPKHFKKIMVIMFENMSYAEIKNEPTFKKLVEYSGNTLDMNGRLVKLAKESAMQDSSGNGYAFFSQYYNNHSGGIAPTRPSQPNYIAMTSGSIQGVLDNNMYDLNVDNLAMELIDAKLTWKVYADDLPDPKSALQKTYSRKELEKTIPPFIRDGKKSEAENDLAEKKYIEEFKRANHIKTSEQFNALSGCFTGAENNDTSNTDDGYMRKHEPFISYTNIQNNFNRCKNIVNSSHLSSDLQNHMPDVSYYIPNQINDGHNGELTERTVNANAFLSKMLGTDPKTGEPLADAANAPFQQFMAQDGLLIITFDEPSVTGNPDQTIYTVFAGKMVQSGAYPANDGRNTPICYPANATARDSGGTYAANRCNHYNLLKMIEANWNLRGLDKKNTSEGYKAAYALDKSIQSLWK